MPDDKALEAIIEKMQKQGATQDELAKVIQANDDELHPWKARAAGALEGIGPGVEDAVSAVPSLIKGTFEDAVSMYKGEEPKNAKAFVDSFPKLKKEWDEGGPRERAKILSEAITSLGVGGALGYGIKEGSGPTARTGGALIENTARRPGLRWAGVGMTGTGIYTGNLPLAAAGLGVTAVPQVLEAGGRAIKRWGEARPKFMAEQVEKFKGGPTLPDERPPIKVMANTSDAWDRAKADSTVPVPETGMSTGLSAQDIANLEKRGFQPSDIIRIKQRAEMSPPISAPTPAKRGTPIVSPAPVVSEPKVPITKILASGSKRSEMSATPGLTKADVLAVGGNPDLKYTGASLTKIQEMLDKRALRADTTRINAGLDAGAKKAAELDQP